MKKIFILTCLFTFQISHIKSAKILAVYPTPSISHQVVFRRLTDALIERGHHVTVITTDPKYPKDKSPENLTEIDLHDLSYGIWKETWSKESFGNKDNMYNQVATVLKMSSYILKKQIATKEVQDIIKLNSGTYDLLMIEAFVKPALVFSHIFKAPVILVSSFGAISDNFRAVGVSTHPILYPAPIQQKLYNLTNLEKLSMLYNHWWFENILQQYEKDDDEMLKSIFGPNTPSINQLSNNIDMLLLNIHPIWMDNQPVPPNVVFIGGIHTQEPKELPKDLKAYLDSSKNGIIYFSLGTNVYPELLPSEKIQMFIRVFSQLPYDILWKWNQDTLPGISSNIKISKWLPQSDLLRHPKIKLFITQGGIQSTDEAILAGVPLIGIPMLGDQWYNVQKYVHHEIGVQLDMDSLTEDEFRNAIKKVIDDKSYRENIIHLRNTIRDQPMSALERGVWWIENVLRHRGGKHLRAAGANKSWSEYLELELLFMIIFATFIAVVIVTIIINSLWKLLSDIFNGNMKIKNM